MKIRHRLTLAFFLISVLPLAIVTAYSYHSSVSALRKAAEGQADQMAAEMGERMTWVLADLGDRVQRVWQMRARQGAPAAPPGVMSAPASAAVPAPRLRPGATVNVDTTAAAADVQAEVRRALAEAAPIIERLEFTPAPAPPPPPDAPHQPRRPGAGPRPARGPAGPPGADTAAPLAAGMVFHFGPREGPPRPPGSAGVVVPFTPPSPADVAAWRRTMQDRAERERQVAPDGNVVDRARANAEAAARAAERQRRKAEYQARMKDLAAGKAMTFTVQMDGAVVGEVNATVNRHRMIETVLSLARRERGEVPFVLDTDNEIHTLGPQDGAVVEAMRLDRAALASVPGQSARTIGDWVVVTRHDDSGIVFGIARPLADSLRDMRMAAARNLGLGLLLIVGAFAGIAPLASRLTRHLTTLTDGVQRLAAGERGTRVTVVSRDEVGELAQAFNRMAGELEAHERMLVEQERLKRELELSRQIQVDMLPRAPLRLGLTEVTGVSMPAREVGGDFFNYFALPGNALGLIMGDVSGKGVGAALLMANIQATLRARLPLELDLPALVDALDRDVAANTPNAVYVTLFIAILDAGHGELRYVNAGHNPQYLMRAGRSPIESMAATGLPVGLMPGNGYEQRTVKVGAGDLLFLYTDGTAEAENDAGDMFGYERLQNALAAAPPAASAADVLAAVEAVIRDFRGAAEPLDDATMMAVRVGTS